PFGRLLPSCSQDLRRVGEGWSATMLPNRGPGGLRRPADHVACKSRLHRSRFTPKQGRIPMSVTDTPVDNGVNVQALLDAREALTAAPEAAQFKWRASNTWV